ncbi:SusC/RagA family TonB-linked outer membrane protein [Pontibacter kalidii]|uniref:SusC/RagA family TonB-linked outer membrane protein n=1 Tax=Pontibacter kalidii TaxID=2592049 RepID=UPI002259EDEC|nr:TonB-dependent receptor [Pontibacter kalidii]
MSGYSGYAQQQTGRVRGQVKDSNGEALIGVSVLARNESTGKTRGTTTDGAGAFLLSNLPLGGPYTFSFSYIGFEPQTQGGYTLKEGEEVTLSIQLKASDSKLSEVVVIGYGENTRRNITTAIASVNPSEIADRNVPSANQLLQGQVAGVNLTVSNGTPGGASRVNIRGVSSINGDNEPLYVIDGIPLSKEPASYNFAGEFVQDPLSLINPSDIASIEVLKDAASAAIYGSRATNGVILITTKQGKKGEPKITVSQVSGIQTMPKKLDLLNPQEYIALQQEATENHNSGLGLSPGESGYIDINKVLGAVPADPYDVNWQDLIINENASSHQTDFSFSGASNTVKYYTSAGYQNLEGLLKNSSLERYSLRTNLDFTPNRVLNFGLRFGGSYTNSNSAPNGEQGTALFQRSLEQRPYDRVYKEDGTFNIGGKDILRHNGVQVLENDEMEDKNYQALVNLYGNVNFLKYFTWHSAYNTELRFGRGFRHQTRLHPYAFGRGMTIDKRNNRISQNIDNTLTFFKSWGGDLNTEAMVGYAYYQDKYNFSVAQGTEFPSDDFKHITSATVTTADGDANKYSMESYIGRVMLDYKGRYFLSSSLRYDGSSKFHEDNRYAYFPSVSAGWVFTDEEFFPTAEWFEFGKLRASWGKTGNQDGIGIYSYMPLASGGYNYGAETGLAVTSLGNPDLKWETSTQADIGLDLSFLNGRLTFTYDYFHKETDDLLYNVPTLATSGFTQRTMNIGSMENKGHEFTLTSVNMQSDNFRWTTNFNLADIRNEVTSLVGDEPIQVGGWNAIIVGQPLGVFYGYKQLGIYQTMEEIPSSLQGQGVRPGDMRFEDLDNNGIINSSDLSVIGSAQPNFYGGLTNTLELGNFDVSVFATFSEGNEIATAWRSGLDHMGARDYNQLKDTYEDRWTGPGTSNSTPRATKGAFNLKNSSYYVEDASYLRIKNLTVGYKLPESILKKLAIQHARIYVSATNLYTFTDYSGYDPEASSSLDAKSFGIDNLVTPQPRSFLAGINVSF